MPRLGKKAWWPSDSSICRGHRMNWSNWHKTHPRRCAVCLCSSWAKLEMRRPFLCSLGLPRMPVWIAESDATPSALLDTCERLTRDP